MCIKEGKWCKCVPIGNLVIFAGFFALVELIFAVQNFSLNWFTVFTQLTNIILFVVLIFKRANIMYSRIFFVVYFLIFIVETLALLIVTTLVFALLTPEYICKNGIEGQSGQETFVGN